jgi:hypothetical protein
MNTKHTWKFFRAGGFDQVQIETGSDLMALDQLDKKLWVALACPTSGLHFDKKTLALMDSDKDGRIRADELLGAIKWTCAMLKNPDDIIKRTSPLPLSAINDSSPEGQQLLNSARQVLLNLGKKDAAEISVDDTMDTAKILAQTAFNGDGVIVEDSASDDATKALIREMIAMMGGETDRSGKPGVSQAKVDKFFAEAQAFSDWLAKSEADPKIKPLSGSTETAAPVLAALRPKIEDYFARCQLAAYDPRAIGALNREEKEYLVVAAKDLTISSAEVAGFPLAQIGPNKLLPLSQGLNPAWAGLMAKFAAEIVRPLLGDKTTLSEEEWTTIKARFAPYEGWATAKAGASVEPLGIKRVRDILAGKGKEAITALIAKDKAEEANVASIAAVERLARFTRDIYLLSTNFVSFKDFYDRGEQAIFQAGTLYLDQRSCELTMPVEDAGRHASMAGLAGAYLAYCDCTRKGSGEKTNIVAVFSQGDDENLMVGRNGLFYDRTGKDWDATITKLITNPISLRQAFWMPYKKFVRLIEEQVAKRASAAEAASNQKLQAAAQTTANLDAQKAAAPAPAAPPAQKQMDVGTVAALGVAFGAIGTFFTAIATGLVKVTALGPLAIIATIIGIILLISGPSMILAYLKLRKRNLGPIMDANGWAVNAKAKISVPFGAALTGLPKLPPGSRRDIIDPYAEKRSPWPWVTGILLALAIICYYAGPALNNKGLIHKWTHGMAGKKVQTEQTGVTAPAPAAPAAPSASEAKAKPAAPEPPK